MGEIKEICERRRASNHRRHPHLCRHDSVDVWCQPGYWQLDDALVQKVRAGVPPDGFTPTDSSGGSAL